MRRIKETLLIFLKLLSIFFEMVSKVYLWRIKPHVIVIAGTTGRHWIKETVMRR